MNKESLIKYWNKKFSKGDIFGQRPTVLAREFVNFVKKKDMKKVLDLGCGQGRDCIYFFKNNFEVTGLDISDEAINFLKNEYGDINWVLGDNRELSVFNDSSFDAVYSNLSLHYCTKSEFVKVVSSVFNILKPGGFLFCTLKNIKDKNFGKGKEVERNVFEVHGGVIRHFFEKGEIKNALKNKFEIIKLEEASHVQPDNNDSSNDSRPSVYWKLVARKK